MTSQNSTWNDPKQMTFAEIDESFQREKECHKLGFDAPLVDKDNIEQLLLSFRKDDRDYSIAPNFLD